MSDRLKKRSGRTAKQDSLSGSGKQISVHRSPAITEATAAVWIGIFVPPVTWALQMQLNYWLVRGACVRQSGLAVNLVTLVSVLLLLFAALNSWLAWSRLGREWPSGLGDAISRQRFLAVLGLLMNGIFFIVILAQGIAAFVLHPCQQ